LGGGRGNAAAFSFSAMQDDPTMRQRLPAFVLAALLPLSVTVAAPGKKLELVRADKSARLMELVSEGRPVRSYSIVLGDDPVGHKSREGDERTPEGRYVLDWRNPNSTFTESIHISCPGSVSV
jgi:murein L,D-transpeptidase YafK